MESKMGGRKISMTGNEGGFEGPGEERAGVGRTLGKERNVQWKGKMEGQSKGKLARDSGKDHGKDKVTQS
jgi:hypothetical protein